MREAPARVADCTSANTERLRDASVRRRFDRVPRDQMWVYAGIAAVLAVAGWIWAFSSADMPDILWLLTVALTVVAVALAIYAVVRGRRTTAL
jgi:hypothetical protein